MKTLIISLLLAASLIGSPLRPERNHVSIRNPVTVMWIPLGTGAICAVMPDALPSCAYAPGIVGWLKITSIDGVVVSQELIPVNVKGEKYDNDRR
jgi:hypothetical protein